jgi:hypothetical protein
VFRLELARGADPVSALEDPVAATPAPVGTHREATLLYIEDNLANLSLVETILLSRPRWQTIPALQGQIGIIQQRVEGASERVSMQIDLFKLNIHDLEGVDPFEASTRISSLMTQIETSYTLTARIQQLSLVRFLR